MLLVALRHIFVLGNKLPLIAMFLFWMYSNWMDSYDVFSGVANWAHIGGALAGILYAVRVRG